MRSVSAVSAQNDLDDLLDTVADGGEPVEIVGGRHSAVLVDKRDYDSLMETLHLLSSPANAERLLSAAADVSQGRNLIQAELRTTKE
ncbi:hypothetical protein BJF93_12135 [Xaviernesmea oryzae]|uniref:Antitoxin n=1 Tax=Xaviernesmea oryzae TaxID=464029 RepID=A0A1Q9AVR9_9HYPH|nr:type II toxin-antitoxin system Phd/YefM family antitoxin [Xaviernesmea oryzae]OLP59508.1 hypothetical protein BJF93_12135 [Xaviernesmea oryzae]